MSIPESVLDDAVDTLLTMLMRQALYPEFFKIIRFFGTTSTPRDYRDMQTVQLLGRNSWGDATTGFQYPIDLVNALDRFDVNYVDMQLTMPDTADQRGNSAGRLYYFNNMNLKQKAVVLNILNCFLKRTETHQEMFFNRDANDHAATGWVRAIWQPSAVLQERAY